MQISEIIEVVSADTFKRPIYAGNAIQTVQSTDAKKGHHRAHRVLCRKRRRRFSSVETIGAAANPGLSTLWKMRLSSSDRPELTSAKIIVSGGRALGSSEKFQEVILPLADSWVQPWVPPVQRLTPVTHRTTGRWARRARLWHLSSTSPAAFPVQSSTLQA